MCTGINNKIHKIKFNFNNYCKNRTLTMNILQITLLFFTLSQIEGLTCIDQCSSGREKVNDDNIKDMVIMYIDQGDERVIECLDTSIITDMSYLLSSTFQSFNTDLSCWDVSKVTNMFGMFYLAKAFNNDLSSWNVSSVTKMSVSKWSLEHHLYNCLYYIYYLYIHRYLSFFDSHIFIYLSILLVYVLCCIIIQ